MTSSLILGDTKQRLIKFMIVTKYLFTYWLSKKNVFKHDLQTPIQGGT